MCPYSCMEKYFTNQRINKIIKKKGLKVVMVKIR
jgi:hypothetical protein